MIATSYILLGGEGCPAADIARPAKKRNNYGVRRAASRRFMQNGARTSRVGWHAIDTENGILVHGLIREDDMTDNPEGLARKVLNEAITQLMTAGVHPAQIVGPLNDELESLRQMIRDVDQQRS